MIEFKRDAKSGVPFYRQIVDQIRHGVASKSLLPGERLPTVRELAARMELNSNTIRKAYTRLETLGLLSTRHGVGTFVSSGKVALADDDKALLRSRGGDVPRGRQNDSTTRQIDSQTEIHNDIFNISIASGDSLFKKLRVSIPVGESVTQRKMWQRVIDVFLDKNPFVNVLVDFDYPCKFAPDVSFTSAHHLIANHADYQPIDAARLEAFGFSREELCPGICEPCAVDGELYGVPILRIGSAVWVNREMLKTFKLSPEGLATPGDVFEASRQIESRSKGRFWGVNYMGYHWHADNYGIDMWRRKGRIELSWPKFERFLNDAKRFVGREQLKRSLADSAERFRGGQAAIFTNYLHYHAAFSGGGKDLALIPYPLEKDGFTAEGMFVGCVSRGRSISDETYMLFAFMVSREAQELFADSDLCWFSVRPGVIERQRSTSPFPKGAVQYDYDQREYYSFFDSSINDDFGPTINTETGKCFAGLQDVETTIKALKEYVQNDATPTK